MNSAANKSGFGIVMTAIRRRPLEQCSFAEKVACFVEGFGFLDAASVVDEASDYISAAERFGMCPVRCASNIEACPNRKRNQ